MAAQSASAPQTVVISGTRTAVPASEVGSALTIVSAEELESKQIRLVSDALRAVPGVAVSRAGPVGSFSQLRIRGAEANHTVVLIDGMKINDPLSSEVDFAHLLSAQIDRIEILRGPQSVLYGSEAIGGVISIFTKRGMPGTQSEGSLEGGSLSTVSGDAALRGASGAFDYALSLSALRTDGSNVSRFGGETDGYRNKTALGSARWTLTPKFTIDAALRWRDSRSQYDPQDFNFPPGPTYALIVDGDRRSETSEYDVRVRGRLLALDDRLEQQFGVSRVRTDGDTFENGAFSSGTEGRRTRFDYQGSLRFGGDGLPQVLTLAVERENLDFKNIGPTPASAQNQSRANDKTGLALEYRLRLPSQTALTVSARHDRNDLFDDSTTYRVTAAQPLGGGVKLRASVGSGVTNPTFFELYGFIPGSFDPNPGLKPEKSVGFDFGADVTLLGGAGQLSATYFDADLENEIASTFSSTTFRSSVANLPGKSRRKGLELESHVSVGTDWTLGAAYTYTSSKQPDGQVEVRRPRHVASASVNYALPGKRGGLTLAVDYNGQQQDSDFRGGAPRVELKDYTLVRLAGSYALTPGIDITARVENALDQHYEEVFSYRATGRTYYAGVSVRF